MMHVEYDNESLALGKAVHGRFAERLGNEFMMGEFDGLDDVVKAAWIGAAWAAIDFKAKHDRADTYELKPPREE